MNRLTNPLAKITRIPLAEASPNHQSQAQRTHHRSQIPTWNFLAVGQPFQQSLKSHRLRPASVKRAKKRSQINHHIAADLRTRHGKGVILGTARKQLNAIQIDDVDTAARTRTENHALDAKDREETKRETPQMIREAETHEDPETRITVTKIIDQKIRAEAEGVAAAAGRDSGCLMNRFSD